MKRNGICKNLIGLVFALGFTSAVHALTIDTFTGDGTVACADGSAPFNLQPQSTFISNPGGTLGTYLALQATKWSGNAGSKIIATSGGGLLSHDQFPSVTGTTFMHWDGNNNPNMIVYDGLGAIDFKQDGGTAIVLTGIDGDLSSSVSSQIVITLYDSRDPTGNSYATKTLTSNHQYINETITIPFTDFTLVGPVTFDFQHVGAVTLGINGPSAGTDITVATFKTDSTCTLVPDAQGRVVDDCKVCGGHNQDKDQCGVCFGGNHDMDDCGVCFGGNHDLDDCGVCNGNNASKDLCGICGGDNSTCKDCAGVPNGTAMTDICGVCAGNGSSCKDCTGTPFGTAKVDTCGVCNGDGTSCKQCTKTNQGGTIDTLDERINSLIENAIFFLERVVRTDPKYYKTTKKQIKSIQTTIVKQVQSLAVSTVQCNSCAQVNTQAVASIDELLTKLYQISINTLNKPITDPKGKCRGSIKACKDRQKAQKTKTASLKALARKLYNQAKEAQLAYPQSVCVDGQ